MPTPSAPPRRRRALPAEHLAALLDAAELAYADACDSEKPVSLSLIWLHAGRDLSTMTSEQTRYATTRRAE